MHSTADRYVLINPLHYEAVEVGWKAADGHIQTVEIDLVQDCAVPIELAAQPLVVLATLENRAEVNIPPFDYDGVR